MSWQVLFWFMIPMAASLMIPTGLGYLGDKVLTSFQPRNAPSANCMLSAPKARGCVLNHCAMNRE